MKQHQADESRSMAGKPHDKPQGHSNSGNENRSGSDSADKKNVSAGTASSGKKPGTTRKGLDDSRRGIL